MNIIWIMVSTLCILLGVYDVTHYTFDHWIFYAGLFMLIINPITIILNIISLLNK